MKKSKKRMYQKVAAALTVSMLMTSALPFAGLANIYYEVPIGSDEVRNYDLATMPDAEVRVEIAGDSRDITTDDLESADGYQIDFGVSIEFDTPEWATPGNASASDWDEDIWGSQILSEVTLTEYISEDTKDAADVLGLDVNLETTPYALFVTASNVAALTPGETYTVKVGVEVNIDSVTSYEGKITSFGDEVILNITVPDDNPEKTTIADKDFFEGDEEKPFEVVVNHTLKLPFSFENESILTVELKPGEWSQYYDVVYSSDEKALIVTGKKVGFSGNPITSRLAPVLNITVETDKHIYTGYTYVYVDYKEMKPSRWSFKDLSLEKGKTVKIPLPGIRGEKLLDYTTILVDWWDEEDNYEEFENPDEMLEAKFSEDYKYLTLTAKQELTDIRVRAQIVTDDYTCYHVAAYKVSTGGESMDGVYIPAQNPTWMVGEAGVNGKDYPGLVTWNGEVMAEEDKEAVVQIYSRVYRDGKYLGYFNSKSYRKLMDLKRFFDTAGEYTFQTVFSKDNSHPNDIPDQYWSDFSEPYQYNLPEKKMSAPENLKWNADGSMTWDKVKETYESPSNHRYFGYVYRKKPGDNKYGGHVSTFVSSSNRMDPIKLETGYDYAFKVIAYGDLINYANSDHSDFSDSLFMGTVVEQSDELINALKDGDVKANIEKTELTSDEKDNLKLGIQTDAAVAANYEDLEKLYRESKKLAGEAVDFNIEAEDIAAGSDKIAVVGGVLNGADGIKFEKPSDESLNNTKVNQYRKKSAVNISLTGDLSGELKYPVLITMPVPSGINPDKLIIVHIKHDGTTETIEPRINEDGTASFAVTEFSTFFFVDKTSTGGSSSGGSGGSGGGGGGSFSGVSSGTVTIDAKKGRVNSLTGIIIGTGDGYSKWIAETPQGQAEGAAARWRLQYADGTFAAGCYVTDEQGNPVKDAAGNLVEQPLWELIGGAWYAFGADGYAKDGFVADPALSGTFYVDINTGMKTGWQEIGGQWRYFNTGSNGTKGKMAVSTIIDGYTVDENGVWV